MLNHVQVRSENGYGFLKPGLKTGVGNGIFFGLRLGLDLEMRAAHPYHKFQGVPPGCPKRKFGSFSQRVGYLSSENLFKPSNRKGFLGVVSAEVLKKAGIPSERNENFSDRVCSPCASMCRIRILGSLYTNWKKIYQKTPRERKQSTKKS